VCNIIQNKNPNHSGKNRKQMKRKKAKVDEDDIDDSCPLVDNCLSVCRWVHRNNSPWWIIFKV